MKKIIFYLITAIAFLFTSCTKDGVPGINLGSGGYSWSGVTIYSNTFDSTAMLYIQLPAYRHFIYKDSATGSTDSVVVTESNLNFSLKPATANTPGFLYDTYTLTLTSFTASGNQPWYKGFASCDSDYKNMVSFIDSDFSLSNDPTNLPSFWCPFASSGALQFTKIPSLVIEGTTYYNVYKFFATNGLTSSNTNYLVTTFYWAKGTGIVKRETRTFNSIKTHLLVRYG